MASDDALLGRTAVLLFTLTLMLVTEPHPANSALDVWKSLSSKDTYCKISPRHTCCMFTAPNIVGTCKVIKVRGLSDEEQNDILKTHNDKRRTIAKGLQQPFPTAANMAKLKWNHEAAAVAQLWADQCTSAHDSVREIVTPSATKCGQNIYIWTTTGEGKFDFKAACESWFGEAKDYPADAIGSFRRTTKKTGHFTQAAWAETNQLGCGYMVHQKVDEKGQIWNKHVLVCNYCPIGNVFMNGVGQSVYKAGKACSSCSESNPKCDDGLCASKSHPDDEDDI